jgi:hypothetical protein
MNFNVNTNKNFKHIHLYVILIQRINTLFIDQLQAFMFSEKCMQFWHKNIHWSDTMTDMSDERKAEIKPALRRFLNTYSFYSGNEFLMYKKTRNLVQWIWCNIWISCVCVWNTYNIFVLDWRCIFCMFCDFCHFLLLLWLHCGSMEWIICNLYVGECVYVFVCTYACSAHPIQLFVYTSIYPSTHLSVLYNLRLHGRINCIKMM